VLRFEQRSGGQQPLALPLCYTEKHGPPENRTPHSLIASETRRPWNMAARMRPRRGPSHTGDATIPRSLERVRRLNSIGACQHAAQEPHANLSAFNLQFSKDALNQTCSTVHVMNLGWKAGLEPSYDSRHRRVPRPLRLRPPCGSGTNRTPVTRFGIAFVATTRTQTTTEGTGCAPIPSVNSQELRCDSYEAAIVPSGRATDQPNDFALR
jgi:hypothetical protein